MMSLAIRVYLLGFRVLSMISLAIRGFYEEFLEGCEYFSSIRLKGLLRRIPIKGVSI